MSLFPVSRALPAPILRLLTFVALGVLAGPTYADADLWGHVRFGLDILGAGRLPSVDPYSFTSDVIWVNHEWLAEVLFALGYQWAGVVGLICIKLAVLAGVMALATRSLREDVPAPLVRDFFVGLIILLTFARTGAVRPQLFSVLLFTVLVVTLRSADRSGSRSVFCLPLVFALWANLHGAWITGLCVLGIWCALARWATAGTRAGLFFGCALATLVNPYGYGLWSFLNSTVGTSRPEIADWMPLFSMPWPIVAYECILPALAIFAIVKTRRLSAAYGAVLLVLAVATVRISRVDAFLHTAIVLLLASQITEALGASTRSTASEGPATRRFVPSLAVFLIAAFVVSKGTIPIAGPWTPDAAAIDAIRASGHSRLLTWFDWGEYAIWHMGPGVQVSFDGRRETVYSSRFIAEHLGLYAARPGWNVFLDRLAPDLIWLPAVIPLARHLPAYGWRVVHRSASGLVFARESWHGDAPAAGPVSSRRCFPGV